MKFEEKTEDKRTIQQNKALHLFFTQIAKALNEQGLTVNLVLDRMREGVEFWWTPALVKEILWREIQKHLYRKESTTELQKYGEIDRIYEVMNKFLGERLGVENIPFPSVETENESLRKE